MLEARDVLQLLLIAGTGGGLWASIKASLATLTSEVRGLAQRMDRAETQRDTHTGEIGSLRSAHGAVVVRVDAMAAELDELRDLVQALREAKSAEHDVFRDRLTKLEASRDQTVEEMRRQGQRQHAHADALQSLQLQVGRLAKSSGQTPAVRPPRDDGGQ
jgi:chromosome segregation ATPase